jgi:hypothetical protein
VKEGKMEVKIASDGYVESYCFGGHLSGGIAVEEPGELSAENYAAYRLVDGALTLDEDRLAALQLAGRQNAIRARRERECYSVINRGQLWYEGISLARLAELRQWYKAWRDAPATLIIPDRPAWLD